MVTFLKVLLLVSLTLVLGWLLTWGCVRVMQDITSTIESGIITLHPGLDR